MFTTKQGTARARSFQASLSSQLVAAIDADAKSLRTIAKDAGITESDLLQYLGGGGTGPYPKAQKTIPMDVALTIAAGLTDQTPFTVNFGYEMTPTSSVLPGGDMPAAYSQQFTHTNSTAPNYWSVIEGSLPTGLTLNPSTGLLSGTPTVAAAFNFTIQAVDRYGVRGFRNYSLTVVP